MKPTAGGLFGDFERDLAYLPINRRVKRPYEKQSGIRPEEKIIACATCGICKDIRPCKFLNECLITVWDEPKTYYSWPRFRDDFGYLYWEPLIPMKTNHFAKELFEI
jgi:hypothetical protein